MLGRRVRSNIEPGASRDVQRTRDGQGVPTEAVVDPYDPAAETVALEPAHESASGLGRREPALRAGTRHVDGTRRARDVGLRWRFSQQHLLRVAQPGAREGSLEPDLEGIVPE